MRQKSASRYEDAEGFFVVAEVELFADALAFAVDVDPLVFVVLALISILSIQHLGIVKELVDSHQNNTLIIPS